MEEEDRNVPSSQPRPAPGCKGSAPGNGWAAIARLESPEVGAGPGRASQGSGLLKALRERVRRRRRFAPPSRKQDSKTLIACATVDKAERNPHSRPFRQQHSFCRGRQESALRVPALRGRSDSGTGSDARLVIWFSVNLLKPKLQSWGNEGRHFPLRLAKPVLEDRESRSQSL